MVDRLAPVREAPAVTSTDLQQRAARHAALGDPVRLAVVEELVCCDRSPVELRERLQVESNLLSHHLDVLEAAGFVERVRSAGDGRRRYVRLVAGALDGLVPTSSAASCEVMFVCTQNSARSQLAAALWTEMVGTPARSAGTRPADRVHPGAVAAAGRVGLDLTGAVPCCISDVPAASRPPVVVTVCDQAHEDLPVPRSWLHWSIPDPVADGSAAAFDAVIDELKDRIARLAGSDAA
jgi:protein-tyrosine-phosphatase/DNA-binding transcriptional ArsR family regulator